MPDFSRTVRSCTACSYVQGSLLFASLDVLATKQFASNQLQVGLDVAIALAIGLSFQFVHPRAIRLVDRVFLPERYRPRIALDKLRATLGFRRTDDASPNRAVEAIANGADALFAGSL